MKILLPGGSGQIGRLLQRAFLKQGHEVVVLGRSAGSAEPGAHTVVWDAKTLGDWTEEIDGADVVINLAGRSVSARSPCSKRLHANLAHAMGHEARPPSHQAHGVGWILGAAHGSRTLLKSRSVIPGTLLASDFQFDFPTWDIAAPNLVQSAKTRPGGNSLVRTAKALIELGRG